MKTIYLLRHAEAASHNGADHDRPLTAQGCSDAKRLGDTMRARGFMPAAVLCSPARRTRETLAGLALDGVPVRFLDSLYGASPDDLLKALRQVDEAHDSVLLVAHNPSISTVAAALAGSGDQASMMKLSGGYAPATLSVLKSSIAYWLLLQQGGCSLIDVFTP